VKVPARATTAQEIEQWLVGHLAAELAVQPGEIDVRRPLTSLGLDSMTAVILSGDLEERLGVSLPPDLLEEYSTIESLSRHLASRVGNGSAALQEPAGEARHERARPRSGGQRQPRGSAAARKLFVLLRQLLIRFDAADCEKIPAIGPLLLAPNHLHITDAPLGAGVFPPDAALIVSEHMRRFPLVGWLLAHLGRPVYISRGQGDREALSRALDVLLAGGVVVMAPEGKISKTGGLLQGRTGVAYLATESGSPVLPVVMYGQEKAWRHWLRLRRAPVHLRVGELIRFPAGRATARQLSHYTEELMVALARMLPPEYRGVYAGSVGKDRAAVAK
jgi:1-acyl-sn-glycerol-3-phosphate acyltransferase